MPSAFETVATAIIGVFNTEFAAEGFTAILDNIHESLGRYRTDIGIAPTEDVPMQGNELVQETWIEVRFFDLWTDEIDPTTLVDPTRITDFAERFRRAVQSYGVTMPGTNDLWYFQVLRIRYPDDPTGNKSRFVATIRARGDNHALLETRA